MVHSGAAVVEFFGISTALLPPLFLVTEFNVLEIAYRWQMFEASRPYWFQSIVVLHALDEPRP